MKGTIFSLIFLASVLVDLVKVSKAADGNIEDGLRRVEESCLDQAQKLYPRGKCFPQVPGFDDSCVDKCRHKCALGEADEGREGAEVVECPDMLTRYCCCLSCGVQKLRYGGPVGGRDEEEKKKKKKKKPKKKKKRGGEFDKNGVEKLKKDTREKASTSSDLNVPDAAKEGKAGKEKEKNEGNQDYEEEGSQEAKRKDAAKEGKKDRQPQDYADDDQPQPAVTESLQPTPNGDDAGKAPSDGKKDKKHGKGNKKGKKGKKGKNKKGKDKGKGKNNRNGKSKKPKKGKKKKNKPGMNGKPSKGGSQPGEKNPLIGDNPAKQDRPTQIGKDNPLQASKDPEDVSKDKPTDPNSMQPKDKPLDPNDHQPKDKPIDINKNMPGQISSENPDQPNKGNPGEMNKDTSNQPSVKPSGQGLRSGPSGKKGKKAAGKKSGEDSSASSSEEGKDYSENVGGHEPQDGGKGAGSPKQQQPTSPSPNKGQSPPGGSKDCKENILQKYPDAECTKAKDKDDCRQKCEAKGNEKCQGKQGEIHKLNCKGEKGDGDITCCCSIQCEAAAKTKARLSDELDREVGGDSSGICIEAGREEIKEKLKELCKSEDKVFVARKFCMEEKKGKYYCVKDGKCFGKECKGCIKHECEIQGKKEVANPPKDYMDKHLKEKDFDKSAAINIDDLKDTEKVRQWCTMLQDRKKCGAVCRDFGDRMCPGGKALKYDHDDFCKREEKTCKCCCQPVCKGGGQQKSLVDMSAEGGDNKKAGVPEQKGGEKPGGDNPMTDKASGGDKPGGQMPQRDKPPGDGNSMKPGEDKLMDGKGDKNMGDKPGGNKALGDKPGGDKPLGSKPGGEKPIGDKPGGEMAGKDSSERNHRI